MNNKPEANINKKTIMRLLFSLTFILGISRNAIGPLIPVFAEEFNIGFDTIGFIFFLGVFCGMISIIVLGRLSDRYGRKFILIVAAALALFGIVGMMFSNSVLFLIISYCVLSFGFAGFEVGATLGAADVGEGKKSSVLNRVYKFDSIGALLAPSIIFVIIYFDQNWRIFFIIIFILTLIFFIFFLRVHYPKKVIAGKRQKLRLKDIINPVVLLSSVVLIFTNGVIVQFAVWFTTYFLEFGVRVAYSSLVVSLYWLSVLLGRLIIQKLLTRFDEKKILFFITFFTMFNLFMITFSPDLMVKIIFSFLLGLAVSGIYPILFSIALSKNPGIMGGIYSFLGFVGYGTIMLYQLLTGYIAENFGKGNIIFIQLGSSIFCFIFTILLIRASRYVRQGVLEK